MIKFGTNSEVFQKFLTALNEGNEENIKAAAEEWNASIMESLKADFADVKASNDSAVLAQRGYRQLTTEERDFYQKLTAALKSSTPKQAFADIIGQSIESDFMPATILEDVYRELAQQYPILEDLDFQYVGYLTKWVLNDHTRQKAVWGTITEAIAKEITSAFKVVDVAQSKLSAYAAIETGMLDLGPTFLDAYIRTCLIESISYGLEDAVVNGNGLNCPAGLTVDIHEGVSYSTTTGYPAKSAEVVTELTAKTYGTLIAKLAVNENGSPRNFTEVNFACNLNTYLSKVMPATRVMAASGKYESFLETIFPTKIVICNSVADGKAILYLPKEYHLFMGGSKNGVIDFSDDYKFVEDMRYFKIKQYGAGRCTDNTCSVVLDVSGLKAAAIPVEQIATV